VSTARPAALLAALILLAPAAATGVDAAPKELAARIQRLVRELADRDYDTRESASKALLRIGRPALPLLTPAVKDADAERAWRAKRLVSLIGQLPHRGPVDPKCTNGYMPASGAARQLQTFAAAKTGPVDRLRFRAARTFNLPFRLEIKLYAGDRPQGEPLAQATLDAEWTKPNNAVTGVSRFFRWMEVPLKARLEKGKTYCLVFGSPDSAATNPWLINCFYRDAFPGGEHRRMEGDKPESLGKHDLVFELHHGGQVRLTTVPGGVELSKQEEYGLGHDGVDLRKSAQPLPVW